MVGGLAGTERDLWGIGGEGSSRSVEGRTKEVLHSWSMCLCFRPVHPSLSRVSPGAEGG